jgi:tRNA A37 threonylcarbamoyladenosine biosynthesis protein TsaE
VLTIEWAEKLPAPADPEALEGSRYLSVKITHGEGDQRHIEITNPPTR